jgi:armadillo repeat-containing protein 8
MTRAAAPNALYELRNPTTISAQIEALKQLKYEIVGHNQRKELIIQHGVVAPLTRILEGSSRKDGKRKSDLNGNSRGRGAPGRKIDKWTEDDELRLQAILVVGSLACGMVHVHHDGNILNTKTFLKQVQLLLHHCSLVVSYNLS